MSQQNNNHPWRGPGVQRTVFIIAVALVLYVLITRPGDIGKALSALFAVLGPILGGFVLAYLLNPCANFFERYFHAYGAQRARRALAVLTTMLIFSFILIFLFAMVVPQIVTSVTSFYDSLNNADSTLRLRLAQLIALAGRHGIDINGIYKLGNQLIDYSLKWVNENSEALVDVAVSIGHWIFNFIIIVFIAIYALMGRDGLLREVRSLMHALLEKARYDKSMDFFTRCHSILIHYIWYDLIDGVIVGVANAAFMMVMHMPFVPLISVIVAVTNLAPTFGPIAGAIMGGMILLLSDPLLSVQFLIFTLALQICDGYIIKPRLFGNTLGVPPLGILIGIVLGGRLFGILGILLAIPIVAILQFIYEDWKLRRMKEHGEVLTDDMLL